MTRKDLLTTIGASAFALSVFAVMPAHADVYEDWETDNEVGLSEDEFGTGFGDAGIYDDWDADNDGALSEDEFSTGFYDYYDENDDASLNPDETDAFEDDAGDAGLFDI